MNPSAALERSDEPAVLRAPGHAAIALAAGTRDILTAVGEVLYDWTLADDGIRWGCNAVDVLKIEAIDDIATGARFAAFLDAANLSSRQDAVFNGVARDEGGGVAYQVQYAFLPQKRPDGPTLWIEDTGRWYGDAHGRPARAHGAIRVVNERHLRERKLAYLSRYDELTGYFNRSHLLVTLGEAINDARRLRAPAAFLLVAVDNFRAINAAYGYAAADHVFAGAARRIKSALREGDVIGRYSGNKLGLVLMNCEESHLAVAAERFHTVIRDKVIETDSGSVAATVSIGGVSLPRHAGNVGDATARVQEALELARARGNGHFVAHVNSAEGVAMRRDNAARSRDLVAALDEGRIRLAFEPIVDSLTRRPAFHEALARLVRRDGTIVDAHEFVPLSERLGLIRLVDSRTLELVLEALAASPRERFSVNVSAASIGDSEWLGRLAKAVAGKRAAAERLTVEITESAVIENLDEAAHFVGILHDLGCRVAIDDFGAGHTSFRNLRALAVDVIKIDGSFVEELPRRPDNHVFIRALVDIARNLGVETVAEWVGDEETATLLSSWGVSHLQGRHFGAVNFDLPGNDEATAGPAPDAGD